MSSSQSTFNTRKRFLISVLLLILLYCAASNPLLAASISGFVWWDKNLDNSLNNNEPRIPYAIIRLKKQQSFQDIDITYAKSNGFYEFSNLPAGEYKVCFDDKCREVTLSASEAFTNDIGTEPVYKIIMVDGIACTLHDAVLAANSNQVVGGCAAGFKSAVETLVLAPGSRHPKTTIRLPEQGFNNKGSINIIGNGVTIHSINISKEANRSIDHITFLDLTTSSITSSSVAQSKRITIELGNVTVHGNVSIEAGINRIVDSVIDGNISGQNYYILATHVGGDITGSFPRLSRSTVNGSLLVTHSDFDNQLNLDLADTTIGGLVFFRPKDDILELNDHIRDSSINGVFYDHPKRIEPTECTIQPDSASTGFKYCFPDPSLATATVVGTVWHDQDGNGLRKDNRDYPKTENGIDSITLQIFKAGNPEPIATTTSLAASPSLFPSSGVEIQGDYAFNVPAGSYIICAVDNYSSRDISITSKDAGNDRLDNDFNQNGCTDEFSLTTGQVITIDLGLIAAPVPVIKVSDSCSFEAALRSTVLGIPAGGCFSGNKPERATAGSTISLPPDARYSQVTLPLVNHRINIIGNNAVIDQLHVPGSEAGSVTTAVLSNVTIGSLSSRGDTHLSGSTVLRNLSVGIDAAVFVSGSTICGVSIKQAVFGYPPVLDKVKNPCKQSSAPATNNSTIHGFVWLDNNANGLQDADEPGFGQKIQDIGAPNIALLKTGGNDIVDFVYLDEASHGEYTFEDVPDGDYYLCVSNEFRAAGLTVTTANAGDDAIDSDFDNTPCSYGISVSGGDRIQRDLGLVDSLSPDPTSFDPLPTNDNPNSLSNLSVKTASLSINHQWRTATDNVDQQNPIIFFSAPTSHGGQRGVVRMRRHKGVTQFKFQEWSNLDGVHTNETINIVNIQPGRRESNNTQIEIDRANIDGTRRWKTIRFKQPFSSPPTVILSLQTANGGDAVDVHVRNITTESMQVALFEEERKMGSGHITETFGYLLINSPSDTITLGSNEPVTIQLPFKQSAFTVNHQWKTIGDNVEIRLEEDQTRDKETNHVAETIDVVKINGVYLTQITSAIGGDPSVLRMRTP